MYICLTQGWGRGWLVIQTFKGLFSAVSKLLSRLEAYVAAFFKIYKIDTAPNSAFAVFSVFRTISQQLAEFFESV